METQASIKFRRKADKVRLAPWVNLPATGMAVYFAAEKVPAFIAGATWVVLF